MQKLRNERPETTVQYTSISITNSKSDNHPNNLDAVLLAYYHLLIHHCTFHAHVERLLCGCVLYIPSNHKAML